MQLGSVGMHPRGCGDARHIRAFLRVANEAHFALPSVCADIQGRAYVASHAWKEGHVPRVRAIQPRAFTRRDGRFFPHTRLGVVTDDAELAIVDLLPFRAPI
jgi:hypothetical protein